ncbi:hypothetical protein DES53_1011061 [Roseimicrobium gellanilyticum]|uniref:Uncharacterized protein n=1 Tax=Roseimicrobium gellanilyticum TaxID=748857 RepID=A0A366HX45_9BACT|nr:KH domain-containing protein [Roseimicrobium gellanilyticum]RBP48259.1 hypothetical protein DES53_1011061 [Roseimicrobium gellanilyticum]
MDAPEALREFLMYVIANLIEQPKQASIAVGTTQAGAISYRIHLAPEDVRRVVGKNGFTISAIRSLVNVAAARYGVKVSLRVDGVREEEFQSPQPAGAQAGAGSGVDGEQGGEE